MDKNLYNSEEFRIGIIAILAALLIAANEVTQGGVQGLISTYAYWVVRVLIESVFFVATLYAIEKFIPDTAHHLVVYAASMFISLIPFTLAITSLDLIVGLPELGLEQGGEKSITRFQAFGLELVYLFDNHLVLCLLLLLPRFLFSKGLKPDGYLQAGDTGQIRLFHESIEPPLEGLIFRIEAQEHYIRIITDKEKRMVLYRFSDAVREMPESLGMQVHRSHWVAYRAIEEVLKEGQKLQLQLLNREIVPVSRSFQSRVEPLFEPHPDNPANTKASS